MKVASARHSAAAAEEEEDDADEAEEADSTRRITFAANLAAAIVFLFLVTPSTC
jgi:hypothetical protein